MFRLVFSACALGLLLLASCELLCTFLPLCPTAPAPEILPPGGTFVDSVVVTLTCSDNQAAIRYTADGREPTSASTPYGGPLTLTNTAIIKARAFRAGHTASAIASSEFVIGTIPTAPTPTITPDGGTFAGSVQVTLACTDAQATIRFTTDGNDPTGSSTPYGQSFTLANSATVKARAFRPGYAGSAVALAVFTIDTIPTVPTPTITPDGGTFADSVIVTLACSDSQAAIRYTTHGGDPTSASTLYSRPITLSDTATVKARAFRAGHTNSAVASAAFTINQTPTVPTPTITPDGGTFSGSVHVLITCADTQAEIRYTTNGSDPLTRSPRYTSPIALAHSATVKARAYRTSFQRSEAASHVFSIQSHSWRPLGAGLNDRVFALAVYNGELIAGGSFTMTGGNAANRVARWDGTTWRSLGMGTSGAVLAMAVYGGELIAGGTFTEAGGAPAAHIARWDGSSWRTLGNGVSGTVYALTVLGVELIVAGNFATAGSSPANCIARWNGRHWASVGTGVDDPVLALTIFDRTQLIAGGSFTQAGSEPANRIARWDGRSWQPLGAGLNSTVRGLAEFDGELIAGGEIGAAGGTTTKGIARWNGTNWQPIGTGMEGTFPWVYALTAFNDELIAGGYFTSAGSVAANRIARWSGSSWEPLGQGVGGSSPSVNALAVFDGGLIAGGNFSQAGGNSALYIARWGP